MRITRSGDWKLPSTRPPAQAAGSGLDLVREPAQAAILLHHPLRLKILAALLEPDSATGVARRMDLPRQTVNYHVRELARARLLARVGISSNNAMSPRRVAIFCHLTCSANSPAIPPK
jgi:DNA-binding transcriptional ArsR family regulator